jgi:hypothetical protein
MAPDALIVERLKRDYPLYPHYDSGNKVINQLRWIHNPAEELPAILYNLRGFGRTHTAIGILRYNSGSPQFGACEYEDLKFIRENPQAPYHININNQLIYAINGQFPLGLSETPVKGTYLDFILPEVIISIPVEGRQVSNLESIAQYQ